MIAGILTMRTAINELAKEFVAVGESVTGHAFRWADRLRGLFRKGQIHRPVFAAKESSGGEGLQFLLLSHPFESLPDVDKRRHDLIPRA